MFLRVICIYVFISVTHQEFLKYLPTSDDLRNSRVNHHKQTLCMIKVGSEICFNASKSPGDAEEVASTFKIIEYGDSSRVKPQNENNYESARDDDNDYQRDDDDGSERDDDDDGSERDDDDDGSERDDGDGYERDDDEEDENDDGDN